MSRPAQLPGTLQLFAAVWCPPDPKLEKVIDYAFISRAEADRRNQVNQKALWPVVWQEFSSTKFTVADLKAAKSST